MGIPHIHSPEGLRTIERTYSGYFRNFLLLLWMPLYYISSRVRQKDKLDPGTALALVFNSIKSLKVYARGLEPKGLR